MIEKNIKLIALDLDGTTLNNRDEITTRTKSAFKEAKERGAHIVVSTGRAFQSLPEDIFNIKELEYVITSNGAHITRLENQERIYEDYIPAESIEMIAEMIRETGISTEIFINGKAFIEKDEYDDIVTNGSSYRSAEYIISTRNPIDGLVEYMLEHKSIIENININFPIVEDKYEFRPRLDKIPFVTITSSFIHNYEIGGAKTSKAQALKHLMDMLGISEDELMACGDSPNDSEMIKLAKIGVVMGNASDEMKAIGDYIAPANYEDGVAEAIERFVINK